MFRLFFILLISLFLLLTSRLQAISDTNQNGVSDPWERFFNSGALYTTFTPTADSDGDGWTDSQEAIAGTDPRSGNPLTGHVRPKLTHTRAVFSPGTPPTLLTPEAITLTWPTLAGKKYTLFFSPNLTATSWVQIGEPRIGVGTEIGTGIPLTQPDGTTPAAGFWRVTIADIDTDSDTLTDAEEHQLGSSPYSSDTDSDGLTDLAELVTYRTNPTSRDTDRDGVSDSDEVLLNFTNPLTATDADSDSIPDDLEKDFARQFLAFQPTSAAWGNYYAGLATGNLNPNHDYTGDGVSVGTIASTIKENDSTNQNTNSSSYSVESQRRRSFLTGNIYPASGGQPARTDASLFQSLTGDSSSRIDFNQPADLSYQCLNSRFHSAIWIPDRYKQSIRNPIDISLGGINWSSAWFKSSTEADGVQTASGTYIQKRFRLFSRSLSCPSFNRPLIKITSKSPSDIASTSLNTTYKAELLPFASQSGRFYSNWVEIQTTMSGNQDEYASVSKVNLISDLNNDGGISNADNSLLDAALLSGATDEIKDKGTEFIFQNDNLSNGIWDKDDPDPARPATAKDDDDAEFINFGLTIYRGEVWLDHPAIAGLSFYKTRECKAEDKVNFSPNSKFSVSSSNPIPNGLYIRVDGELAYPEANPQFEGDLVLKIKVDPNDPELEVARMKLTVVKQLGAKKYFHAAQDYILENNAASFLHYKYYDTTDQVLITAMREQDTIMRALDTYHHTPKLYGIDQVTARYPDSTVIINGNMTFDLQGIGGGLEMTQRCHGRLISSSTLNTNTSSDNEDDENPPPNFLGIGHPLRGDELAGPLGKYIAMVSDGNFTFAKGRVPIDPISKEALGGLSTNYTIQNPEQFVGIAKINQEERMLFTVTCALTTSGVTQQVAADAKQSGVEALPGGEAHELKLFKFDGGTSLALSHEKPDGTLTTPIKGSKHTGRFFKDYCIHTYLMFKSKRPRNDE